MPTKPKLPRLLKALLALHGVCIFAALLFAVRLLMYGDWPLRYIWDCWNWSYFGISLVQILGLLLPVLFVAFLMLFRRRKKASLALLAAIASMELTALAGYPLSFLCSPVMDSNDNGFMFMLKYDPGYFFLFIAAPVALFAGTLTFLWLSRKTIKTYLENNE